MIRPPFNLVRPDLLVQFKYALPLLGISICLLEVSYPVFHLVEKDAPDLVRLYFGDACCHRIDDGAVPLRARHDCDEPGGIWRSQYGQESIGDFSNYLAIKIHTKATGFGRDEAAVLKS